MPLLLGRWSGIGPFGGVARGVGPEVIPRHQGPPPMVDDLKAPIGVDPTSGGPVANKIGNSLRDKATIDLGPRGLFGCLVPVIPPGKGGDGWQLDQLGQLLVG